MSTVQAGKRGPINSIGQDAIGTLEHGLAVRKNVNFSTSVDDLEIMKIITQEIATMLENGSEDIAVDDLKYVPVVSTLPLTEIERLFREDPRKRFRLEKFSGKWCIRPNKSSSTDIGMVSLVSEKQIEISLSDASLGYTGQANSSSNSSTVAENKEKQKQIEAGLQDVSLGRAGQAQLFSKSVRTINFRSEDKPMLIIPGKVNDRYVDVVVDTGAEITVVNEDLMHKLSLPLRIADTVYLEGAVPGAKIEAKLVKNLPITLGTTTVKWDVYLAPVAEDFILGLDFLLQNHCTVDLSSCEITIGSKKIGAKVKRDNGQIYRVSRIMMSKKTVVPPQTSMNVSCALENPMDNDYLFSPYMSKQPVVFSESLHASNPQCHTRVFNHTDKYITLKKDEVIGCATEIEYCYPTSTEILDAGIDVNRVLRTKLDKEPATTNTDPELNELPEHLRKLFEDSTTNLDEDQCNQLKDVLIEFQDVFSKGDHDLGCFTELKFKINTGTERPVKHKLRRTPFNFEQEERQVLNKMLETGIIRPSTSEWASSPVLIRKKDGTVRYCLDYRDLNAKTMKDRWPLPSISSCMDTLEGNEWFSSLDLASGYWQFLIEEEDIPKTAFLTKFGLYEHVRMAFGLTNAPSFCQKCIELVLRGMTWEEIIAYLDDVMVLGKDFRSHLDVLRRVFERFRKFNLKLKPKKCHLFQKRVPFLGRLVSKDGVEVDPEKVKAVETYPQPKNSKEVEKFLGFANYHREFIERFAERSDLLYQLTGNNDFVWTEEHTEQFLDLRRALVSTPVLAYPQADAPFILDTDASDTAVAGVLSQIQDGKERVISYGSAILAGPQRNYCTTRKELLAIIKFTRQYRHYLLGRTVRVRTDNSSLLWLTRFKEPCGQIARWLEELSQYDLQIEHRKGKLHVNADTLSRIPDDLEFCPNYTGKGLSELPCGGCRYCTRAHQTWARFDEEVDDVVPLAVKRVNTLQISNPPSNWFDSITNDEWVEEQRKDSDLTLLRDYLENKIEPTEPELYLQSSTAKSYWSNRTQFKLANAILFYNWTSPTGDKWLHVVPRGLKGRFCKLAHDNPTTGHMGQDKSYRQLQTRVYWSGMRQDIKEHVQSCHQCNISKKTNRKPKYALQSYHAGVPMERVHLDILGPFQTSQSGNKYLLVMVDQFTKWIEIEPLPEQSAEKIAKAAVDRFFSHFGYPITIHTDQGRNFDGELFKSLCQLLHIAKTRTTPYRPSSNGQVERYNRTILQTIRAYLQSNLNQWDEYIQLIAAAIRATVNRSTGYTPNMLMLGKEVRLPLDLMIGPEAYTHPSGSYLQQLQQAMVTAHDAARENLKSYQKRQKKDYDINLKTNKFDVGDVVYLLDSSTKVKQSTKLRPIYKGPYVVSQVLSPLLFKVKDQKRESVIHHDRMKPCLDHNLPLWLRRMRHELLNDEPPDPEEEFDVGEALNQMFSGLDDLSSPPATAGQNKPTKAESKFKEKLPKTYTAITPDPPVPDEEPATTRCGRQSKRPGHMKDYIW